MRQDNRYRLQIGRVSQVGHEIRLEQYMTVFQSNVSKIFKYFRMRERRRNYADIVVEYQIVDCLKYKLKISTSFLQQIVQ